ncbi:MAG: hypothetical protein WC453_02985 [Patescibacteria group bacterium]
MLKELVLATRTSRLVTITILASLCFFLFISNMSLIVKIYTSPLHPTSDQMTKLVLILIALSLGTIVLAYLSLSLSAEEKAARDKSSREQIINNLREAVSAAITVTTFDMELSTIIRKFSDCISQFKPEDLPGLSAKILLIGAANSLAVIYYCLDLKDYQKQQIISKKPQNWDYILSATQEEINNIGTAKKELQESYEQIHNFARRHISVVSDTGKNKYTLYADAAVLLLLKDRRKKMKTGAVPMNKYYYRYS